MTYDDPDYTKNVSYCFPEPFQCLRSPINLVTDGLYKPITIEDDANFFRNDWASLAFRGFASLSQRRLLTVRKFLTIGTGSGLDAIGAIEAFHPDEVVVTELTIGDARKALENIRQVKKTADMRMSVTALSADVIAPNGLRELEDRQFDLIYENLPNLPSTLVAAGRTRQPSKASFVDLPLGAIPERYTTTLLGSHFLAARNLRPFLAPNGCIMCNIGGRVPFALIEEMFRSLGYKVARLVLELKLQTEADSNLPAYARWEQDHHNLRFDFYPYDVLHRSGFESLRYDRISGFVDCADKFDQFLHPMRWSAERALKKSRGQHKHHIAHTVHTLLLQPVPQKVVVR